MATIRALLARAGASVGGEGEEMKRLHACVVLAICGLAAFALLTASAIAKNPARNTKPANSRKPVKGAPVVPGSRYLALGDSVTFGYEESTVVPAPNYFLRKKSGAVRWSFRPG
jgi:hypothetical protein